jgi:hypothetical protein
MSSTNELSTLSPTHAYHLEGILRDGTLSPYELNWLIEKHVTLARSAISLTSTCISCNCFTVHAPRLNSSARAFRKGSSATGP